MGLSETPSNRKMSLEGFCVGLFVRYPLPEQWKTKGSQVISVLRQFRIPAFLKHQFKGKGREF